MKLHQPGLLLQLEVRCANNCICRQMCTFLFHGINRGFYSEIASPPQRVVGMHMRRVRRLRKAQLRWKDPHEIPQRHRERLAQESSRLEQLYQVRLHPPDHSMVRCAHTGTCHQMSTIRVLEMGMVFWGMELKEVMHAWRRRRHL